MPAGARDRATLHPLIFRQGEEGFPGTGAGVHFQDARNCIDLMT